MSYYPEQHHPVFFLRDALEMLGADASFNHRDGQTEGCWGLIVNGKPVVWLIDNRWPHEREKEDPAARKLQDRGALVMCAQKPDAERIGSKWLPLAVTPGYRPPLDPTPKLYDVGFVGYIRDEQRLAVLKNLSRHFTVANANGVFGNDAVRIYWDSKVGINIPTRYGDPLAYDSANMRCFEILATGTPLVTPYEPYLDELGIVPYSHCMAYHNADELIDHIAWLIKKSDEGDDWGEAGVKLVAERHTYMHRAKQVLEWLR